MGKSRIRSSYQKSTLGCRTCKIRRVKCDETQPCCLKCTNSGRPCEGPASRTLNFVADPINHLINQGQPPKNTLYSALRRSRPSEELRAFSFFIDRTAPVLTGQVDAGFWGTTIPQIAQSNQVIWYALIAVAGLWENPPLGPRGVRKCVGRQRQALRWYAQAIANERSQCSTSYAAEKMLICVLCSCFEFQNRNYQSGLLTIRIAYNLLGRSMTAVKKPEDKLLFEALMTKFLRNACFACTSNVSIDISPEGLLNDDELEYSLFQLLLSTYGLLKESYFLLLGQGEITLEALHSSLKYIEVQLQRWLIAAQKNTNIATSTSQNTQHQPSQPQSHRLHSLKAYHTTTTTWLNLLQTLLHHPNPTPTNLQTQIIHRAESILTTTTTHKPSNRSPPALPVYFHDFTLLPPLYFVVMLSTDKSIYARALDLMRSATYQKRGEQNHSLVAMRRSDAGMVGMHMARVRWAEGSKVAGVEEAAFAVAEVL